MAATLSTSVLTSRRNSLQRDQHEPPGRRSRGSSFNRLADDKIAVHDESRFSASQDVDSMKFPLVQPDSSERLGAIIDASFGDFGKSVIEDDPLKGFGILEAQRHTSANTKPGSRDTIRAGDPFLSATVTAPVRSVYELDVPQFDQSHNTAQERARSRSHSQSREQRYMSRSTTKESGEMARTRTAELIPNNAGRKSTAPMIKAPPESPVKAKRLSGLSLRSFKSAFSRNDLPEVVQPPSPTAQPRKPSYEPRKPSQESRRPSNDSRRPSNASRAPESIYRGANSARDYGMQTPILNPRSQYVPPRQPRAMASTPHLQQKSSAVPTPWMTRRPSASSLRSTMSNINKPLPPEPGQMQLEMLHPRKAPQTPRTPNGARTPVGSSPSKPWQETPRSPAASQFVSASRRANTAPNQAGHLRSRYTPKDLDALDDAFQRSMPNAASAGPYSTTFFSSNAPETGRLDAIRESPQSSQHQLDVNAPLQISRGPMRMEPMRRPPPTPGSRSRSPVAQPRSRITTPEPVPQAVQREHIATQKIAAQPQPPTQMQSRMDAAPSRSAAANAKAQQLLGEDDPGHDVVTLRGNQGRRISLTPTFGNSREQQEELAEQHQSPSAQQLLFGPPATQEEQTLNRVENTQMARSESISSHHGAFRTGPSDVQTVEIRRRLELLSPITTTDTSFMSSKIFGQMLSTQVKPTEEGDREETPEHETTEPEPEPQPEAKAEAEPAEETHVIGELPGDTTRVKSMAPVEMPAEPSWAISLAGLYEMAGSPSPRVSIQPATPGGILDMVPPPIPESPKHDARWAHTHTQSMLSSGSGRTKSIRSIKSARSARSAKARSITSAAASEIPELYAGLPSPRYTLASRHQSSAFDASDIPEMPPMPEIATTEELEEMDVISADTAEQVLYQILRNLYDPSDLFSASLVSRGFQRTFRRHDTKLLRNSLWYSSPPAWEYMEMHMPRAENGQLEYPPDVYRQQWIYSMFCLTRLKSMILHHCGKSLSPLTAFMLESRNDKHSAPVDDAIWRIWTFCKIFGEDENRREDLELQKNWIKGQGIVETQGDRRKSMAANMQHYPAFGFGNDEGLTPEELMRMGEIWICLRVLVRGYRGQRQQAREFGIFEGSDAPNGDHVRENALLDEWTIHLLSLAPGTNLDVLCPNTATQENFITAESHGFTLWTPPNRDCTVSGFLTGAICNVLEEWLAEEARIEAIGKSEEQSVHPAFRSQQVFPSRQQVALFVARLQTVKDVLASPSTEPQALVFPQSIDSKTSGNDRDSASNKENSVSLNSSRTVKENKKGLAGFGSKLSLRLPSRSLTMAGKSKAQAPPVPAIPSDAPNNAPEASSSSAGGFFSRSKSTATKGANLFYRNTTKNKRGIKTAVPDHLRLNGAGDPASEARNGSYSDLGAEAGSRQGSTTPGADKLPVYPETPGVAADSDALDHITLTRNRLIELGYEPHRVDDALEETCTEKGVSFDRALKKLKKSRRLEDRLKRLDRMG